MSDPKTEGYLGLYFLVLGVVGICLLVGGGMDVHPPTGLAGPELGVCVGIEVFIVMVFGTAFVCAIIVGIMLCYASKQGR